MEHSVRRDLLVIVEVKDNITLVFFPLFSVFFSLASINNQIFVKIKHQTSLLYLMNDAICLLFSFLLIFLVHKSVSFLVDDYFIICMIL